MTKSAKKSKIFSFSGSLQSHKMRYHIKTKHILRVLEYVSIALTLLLMYCRLGSNTCAFVQESLSHCRTVLILSEFHLFVSAADFAACLGGTGQCNINF